MKQSSHRGYWTAGGKLALSYIYRRLIVGIVNITACGPSYRPIEDIRMSLLRLGGYTIGKEVQVSEKLFILLPGRLTIGNGVRLGIKCNIFNYNHITIGDNLLASHGLTLVSATHDVETLQNIGGPIVIGSNVWIGVNVTIIGPVTVGSGAVIGAGSVVLRDIPENAVAAGVPCKVLRYKKQSDCGKCDNCEQVL
jgi:maltose O-acetyltransferase